MLLHLEYASVAWSTVTVTDSNKLERVQRKFAAICKRDFFKKWNIITPIFWKN
jgi:hypothetical protein